MRLDEWQKYIETQFLEDKAVPKGANATPPANGQITLPLEGVGADGSTGAPEPPTAKGAGDRPAFLAPINRSGAPEPRHLEIVQGLNAQEQTALFGGAGIDEVGGDDAIDPEAGADVKLSLTDEAPSDDAGSDKNEPTAGAPAEHRGPLPGADSDLYEPGAEATAGPTASPAEVSDGAPRRAQVGRPEGAARRNVANDMQTDIPPFILYLPTSRIGELQESAGGATSGSVGEPELDPQPRDAEAPEFSGDEMRRTPKRRARHARNVRPENVQSGLSAAEHWAKIPKYLQTLLALERMEEQEIAQYSYKRPFEEKRKELIERLLDPILSLEDTARLLNVCPTTVRRYTNKGILTHYRKEPENASSGSGNAEKETRQRRFRLSDVLAFLETQAAAIENDRRADSAAIERAARRDAEAAPAPDADLLDVPETP